MVTGNITDIVGLREQIKGRVGSQPKPVPTTDEMVIDMLRKEDFANEVSRCVPSGLKYDVDRLLRVVQTQLRSDAKLASAEPRSILGAVMQCAEMGLIPGFMGQAYITTIPKVGGATYQHEAQLVVGYRGMIALAMRSGGIKSISSRIVTDVEIEKNLFQLYYEGERDVLLHQPILFGEKGRPVLVYCLIRFDDGSFHVEPMSEDEVLTIKSRALVNWNSPGESAWVTNEMEMWRKTPIRRAMKYLNISVDVFEKAIQLEDKLVTGKSQELHRVYGDVPNNVVVPEKVDPKINVGSSEQAADQGDAMLDPDNPTAGLSVVS